MSESAQDPAALYYLIRLMQTFVKHHDCYLVDDLDLLVDVRVHHNQSPPSGRHLGFYLYYSLQNISKIGAFNFKMAPEYELKLTEVFMELGKTVLLSANLKFTIEKAAIIPSKLYQAKFDCSSICSLSQNLFGYFQFQNVSLMVPETDQRPFFFVISLSTCFSEHPAQPGRLFRVQCQDSSSCRTETGVCSQVCGPLGQLLVPSEPNGRESGRDDRSS